MTDLRKAQLVELEILTEVDRICRKENITYYLYYGTLLGAVRHGGFIPWDDDIDIVLLREDYDKLMVCLKTELGEKFWLQNYETDENYWLSYAKVRKKGTIYREVHMDGVPDEKSGVWIDIFPLDNMPRSKRRIRCENFIINAISNNLLLRANKLKLKNISRRYRPVMWLLSLFTKKRLKKMQDKLMRKHNKKETGFVLYACAALNSYKEFPIKKDLFEVAEISFEGQNFLAPKNYDEMLKLLYGDYMTPPPEDKRVAHNIVELRIDEE